LHEFNFWYVYVVKLYSLNFSSHCKMHIFFIVKYKEMICILHINLLLFGVKCSIRIYIYLHLLMILLLIDYLKTWNLIISAWWFLVTYIRPYTSFSSPMNTLSRTTFKQESQPFFLEYRRLLTVELLEINFKATTC
jgi:hypothetical protein